MALRYKGDWKPDKFLKIPKTYKKYKAIIHFADGKSMWVWHYQTDPETGAVMYLGKGINWKPVFGKANMIAYNIAPEAIIPLEEIGGLSRLGRVNFCWQKTDGVEVSMPHMKGLQADILNKSWENRNLKAARANSFALSRSGIIDPQESQTQHTKHVSQMIDALGGPRPEYGLPKDALSMIRGEED